jgi:hypothetical protein
VDGAHVGTRFEQIGSERVPQRVQRDRLADASTATGLLARMPYRFRVDGLVGKPSCEQPVLRSTGLPLTAQDPQQSWREHHIAVDLAFALFYAQHHSRAVDVTDLQSSYFRNTQAARVRRKQVHDGPFFTDDRIPHRRVATVL